MLRDTEIESDIRTMATPIWRAAGLEPSDVGIYLVDDKQLNSFVAGGQAIFINTGLILRAENAEPADRGHRARDRPYRRRPCAARQGGDAATPASRASSRWCSPPPPRSPAAAARRCSARRGSGERAFHAILGGAGGHRRPCRADLSRPQPASRPAGCCILRDPAERRAAVRRPPGPAGRAPIR